MSTTTGKLAKELNRFSQELGDVVDELRSELDKIKKMQRGLMSEMDDTVKGFVGKTLTGYEGGEFDTIAEIAQNVEELSVQSLAYLRNKLLNNRDVALNEVNQLRGNIVDPEGFQSVLQQVKKAYEEANDAYEDELEKLDSAELALDSWRENTMEDDLVELDDNIAKAGGLRLTSDNRDYYEVPNILVAVWRYVTDPTYRKVRHTLEDFGHLRDGKDGFADLSSFRAKFEGFEQTITKAQEKSKSALAQTQEIQINMDKLSVLSADIITDKQLLEKLQNKVANDLLESPEYIEAMANHYAEDFPRNLGFLVAKLTTLNKLKEGTQSKFNDAQENYNEVKDQYNKIKRLRSGLRVRRLDLDDLRRQNDAYRNEIEHYTNAARRARERANEYGYDNYDYARQNSGRTVNSGPSLMETVLIYHILTSHNRPYSQQFEPPTNNDLAKDSGYVTDLMGVDQEAANKARLPKGVFDISSQTSKEMADLGVKNYKPGDLKVAFDIGNASSYARSKGIAFDIKSPPPPPRPSYSSSSIGGGSSSFKIGGGGFSSGGGIGGGGGSFKI